MVKIPVKYLQALAIFSGKKCVRHYINGVFIDKEAMVATNGHIVARIKIPRHDTAPAIIPIEEIQIFLRRLSNTEKTYGDVNIGPNYLSLCGSEIKQGFTPIDGKFPYVDSLIPIKKQPVHTPRFNWEYMFYFKKAAAILTGNKNPSVDLTPYGRDPALVEIRGMDSFTGVIMPMIP